MKRKKLFTIVLDGSLDLSLGIIGAVAISTITNVEMSWDILVAGVLGAYAPDIDGVYHLAWKEWNSETLYKHRSYTHFPTLFLPAIFLLSLSAMFVVNVVNPLSLALSFTLGSLLHFVHDNTFIHGWGIFWFYPFNDKRVVLFQHSIKPGTLPKILIYPGKHLEAVRAEHFDNEWNAFFKLPPHPWWYAFIAIHLLATTLIVETQIS